MSEIICLNTKIITTRPAVLTDLDFLLELRRQTMVPHLRISELPYTTTDLLNRIHYGWEHAQIILVEQVPVGLIKASEHASHFEIHQLQILPEWQGKKIGTNFLLLYCQWAQEKKKYLQLQVLKCNPAISLYQKLGFIVFEEQEKTYTMRWQTV